MSGCWRPSMALHASVALHGAAGIALLANPGVWPWALGALAANHAILTAAGLLPRSKLLGENITRLPADATARREISLTFDDGPNPEVTPVVLDMLDEAGIKATFFCIGYRARQYPVLCRQLAERGHRVENHGDSHSKAFAAFGPARMHADISAAQSTLADITGQAPRFFRATAGLRNPFLDPVLNRLGLRLAAWTRRSYDTRTGDPDTVVRRLTRNLHPGDILLLHDGHGARDRAGRTVVLAALPRLLRTVAEQSLRPVTLAEALP